MVAIKDMEMPTCCNECRMKKRCEQGIAGGWRKVKRVDDCPLVEIITCEYEYHEFNPDGVLNYAIYGKVVAWMPLPDPYEESEGE